MIGESLEAQIYKLSRQIIKNRPFLTFDDVKVLEFLATKGDFETKKAIIVEK